MYLVELQLEVDRPSPEIYELESYDRLRGLGLSRHQAKAIAAGFAGDYAAWLEAQPT